jgi:hypothetical protein
LAKLQRLATKVDSIVVVHNPVSEEAWSDRNGWEIYKNAYFNPKYAQYPVCFNHSKDILQLL